MENHKNKAKRQRSENWLEEDKNLLVDLVRERVSAIENKNTDTNTNSRKLAAWADLLNSFNSMCKGGPRTLSQVKSQWGKIKMTKKKMKSDERKELFRTGGGPPPSKKPENDDDICSWLPNEFIIDTNNYDSDNLNQVNVGKVLQKTDTSKVDDINKKDIIELHGHNVHTILDETPDIGTTSQVNDSQQDPLQGIENTQKVVSAGSSVFKKPSSKKPKKKENMNKASAAERITTMELACRKQLHEVQMANEERRARNLDLEETLLKVKIDFYKKRLQSLE